MMLPVVVRHPRPDESLTGLWPALEKYHLNLAQVYVAERAARLVGGAILWDAGHDIVHVSNLVLLPEVRDRGVAVRLMDAIMEDMTCRERRVLIGTTGDVRMAYWAQKKGALVGPACHYIWWEIA